MLAEQFAEKAMKKGVLYKALNTITMNLDIYIKRRTIKLLKTRQDLDTAIEKLVDLATSHNLNNTESTLQDMLIDNEILTGEDWNSILMDIANNMVWQLDKQKLERLYKKYKLPLPKMEKIP